MEKQLRQNVGYPGTPVRLLWRSKPKAERGKAIKGAAGSASKEKRKPAEMAAGTLTEASR